MICDHPECTGKHNNMTTGIPTCPAYRQKHIIAMRELRAQIREGTREAWSCDNPDCTGIHSTRKGVKHADLCPETKAKMKARCAEWRAAHRDKEAARRKRNRERVKNDPEARDRQRAYNRAYNARKAAEKRKGLPGESNYTAQSMQMPQQDLINWLGGSE